MEHHSQRRAFLGCSEFLLLMVIAVEKRCSTGVAPWMQNISLLQPLVPSSECGLGRLVTEESNSVHLLLPNLTLHSIS
ncbi:hypothetical protein J6590_026926 [Homalodisca vitripennis]|nr:hypothetical protein J6590_026926 [Homalodisca vitripennis]